MPIPSSEYDWLWIGQGSVGGRDTQDQAKKEMQEQPKKRPSAEIEKPRAMGPKDLKAMMAEAAKIGQGMQSSMTPVTGSSSTAKSTPTVNRSSSQGASR